MVLVVVVAAAVVFAQHQLNPTTCINLQMSHQCQCTPRDNHSHRLCHTTSKRRASLPRHPPRHLSPSPAPALPLCPLPCANTSAYHRPHPHHPWLPSTVHTPSLRTSPLQAVPPLRWSTTNKRQRKQCLAHPCNMSRHTRRRLCRFRVISTVAACNTHITPSRPSKHSRPHPHPHPHPRSHPRRRHRSLLWEAISQHLAMAVAVAVAGSCTLGIPRNIQGSFHQDLRRSPNRVIERGRGCHTRRCL